MSQWIQRNKKGDFFALAKKYKIDPVTARVILNRGVAEADFGAYLNPSIEDLHDPHLLKDVDRAAELIAEAIAAEKKIRVVGDYDADGVNSTYILHQALMECGAQVDYAIPRRMEDGYGINPQIVERAQAEGVSVIVTCDNGIAAQPAMLRGKELGLTVIVTDHHDVPLEEDGVTQRRDLAADAVVNPKQESCHYPFAGICGATVAWKLVLVLYERMGLSPERAMRFLENVAFATVCDMMSLENENRALVRLGLERIRKTDNVGLRALMEQMHLVQEAISAYDFGFRLGPCVNSSGRLESAMMAIALLEEENPAKASLMAEELVALNEERKGMLERSVREAIAMLEGGADTTNTPNVQSMDPILVIYMPKVHESLAGLVASRLKERYYRPCIVLTNAQEEGMAKGSGRSIEGYHMFEGLSACKHLFEKFGGHPMAAGLTLRIENIEEMRQFLNEHCGLTKEDLTRREKFDADLSPFYITDKLLDELECLEPTGNGNPQYSFARRHLRIDSLQSMGKDRQHLRIFFTEDGLSSAGKIEAVYWSGVKPFREMVEEVLGAGAYEAFQHSQESEGRFRILYRPKINDFRGQRSIQLVIQEMAVE